MASSSSLKSKLVSTMILILLLVGVITISIVVWMQYDSSKRHLHSIETLILDSIKSKGNVLVENHALALKGLVADNAITDVNELIKRAVAEDEDVVYGLFVNSDKVPWAYSSPSRAPNAPISKALAELKIPDNYLDIKRYTTRDTRLFNLDILEVAMPVIDEDFSLGIVVYGLSLARAKNAVQKARSESMVSLRNTIIIIVVAALLTTLLGIAISSKQARKITKPLADLTSAASELAAGDMTVRVNVSSKDEIQTLGATFNQMVSDLAKSYEELESLNRTLEQKVENRTAALSARNQDMRLVLDNINQGLLMVDKDCIMSNERSALINDWFGSYDDGTVFTDYLCKFDQDFGDWFELGFEALWEGFLPLEVCIDQLPNRLRHNDREYRFSYQPIKDETSQELSRLLVVIADVTEQLKLERKEAHQREVLNVFSRVMCDKSGYLSAEREIDEMINQVLSKEHENDLVQLRRVLHTLKGNCSLLGLNTISNLCHQVEDDIFETNRPPTDHNLNRIRDTWGKLKRKTSAFTEMGNGTIEITKDEYEILLEKVHSKAPHSEIMEELVAFRLEPIKKIFLRIREQTLALAHRLNKGDIRVEIVHNGLRLESAHWAGFWSSLAHVIRNAVDHGFGDPSERDRPATIILKAAVGVRDFVIEVSDNGNGIDWKSIEQKAKNMNLPAETRQQLTDAIFSDGLSTRDNVTDISGRGVGMGALRQCVREMHGQVTLKSEIGQGTSWKFTFPREQMEGSLWKKIEQQILLRKTMPPSDSLAIKS